MIEYLIIAMTALLVAGIAPLALVPMLERAGVVDLPNERSSHTHRAIRGGGIAQLMGITAALIAAMFLLPDDTFHQLGPILVALLATGALGWVEDARGLLVAARAGFQAGIGAVVVLIYSTASGSSLWWIIVGIVAVIGLVNVVNFMDGVNGMSAAHAVVAGGTFAIVGALHDRDWLVAAGVALAAAFAGFLPWNFNGRLFLGDVGSYLLGGTSAVVIVFGWIDGLPVIALAAPFVIYVADTGVTLVGRILARERWYEAHRDHTYQRFNRRGLSHLEVTALLTAASAVIATFGVIASETSSTLVSAGTLAGAATLVTIYTAARFTVVAEPTREGC